MGVTKREATIDELLSDPMMATVLQYSRKTADEVRSLMRDARARLARARATETEANQPDTPGGSSKRNPL